MKINVLTLFPEMFDALKSSMTGRAIENGIIELNLIDIRDYTEDKHNHVDDTPYGGGAGMVMQVQPILDAFEKTECKKPVVYMSPRGEMLDGKLAEELSKLDELTVLCGHYEGIDQRALDALEVSEVSIGDYVLTGGELPAMVMIDTLSRFIDGVLASEESVLDESIYSGLLEYPHYSKPREINGMEVPEVLLSGNHQEVDLWRWEQALSLTKEKRPDLFEKYVKELGKLSKKEQKILDKYL